MLHYLRCPTMSVRTRVRGFNAQALTVEVRRVNIKAYDRARRPEADDAPVPTLSLMPDTPNGTQTYQSNTGLCLLDSHPLYNAPFGPN